MRDKSRDVSIDEKRISRKKKNRIPKESKKAIEESADEFETIPFELNTFIACNFMNFLLFHFIKQYLSRDKRLKEIYILHGRSYVINCKEQKHEKMQQKRIKRSFLNGLLL